MPASPLVPRPDPAPAVQGGAGGLRDLLRRLLSLGVSPRDDAETLRRVQISNALYVISLFVATGTTVGPYLAGQSQLALVGAFMLPTTLVCLLLNARGAIRASRVLLLTALNVVMLGMASVVGADVLAATIFVVVPIPFFLFDRTELPYLAGSLVLIATTAVLLHIPGLFEGPATIAGTNGLRLLFQAISFGGLTSLLVADFLLRKKLTTDLAAARLRAEETSDAKGMFLANMSHEIRTPLGAVLGYADLLDDRHATTEQRQNALEAVRRNGVHLMQLINDVLDVSKIEAGELLVDIGPVSPTEVVSDAVSGLRIAAEDKGITLALELPAQMPRTVQSDGLRMRQILLNLLGNALKFTRDGGVTVTAEAQPGYLAIHVTDTGIGIAEDVLPKLFENFAQADPHTARQFGGTGLGLVISKRLADRLGGRLTVQSELGVGSTFTSAFPLAAAEAADRVAPGTVSTAAAPAQEAPGGLGSVRVLLAEDFLDASVLIELHLRRQGGQVTTVANGQAALQALASAESPFDVVLMDMQMPVMDGLTAIRHLREAGNPVPVVLGHSSGNTSGPEFG
jgi:signal transduction histidine kinase